MVTIENWEEYAILRADGELDAAGQEALESFLEAHPELAGDAQLYDSMRLVPDEAVVFAGKDSLLKPEPRVIALDRRWMWAAAACMALLIGATALLRNSEGGSGSMGGIVAGSVKLNTAPEPVTPSQPAVSPIANRGEAIIATPAQPGIARQSSQNSSVTPAPSIALPSVPETPETTPTEAVTPLSSADSRMLAVTVLERSATGSDASPISGTSMAPKEESNNLLTRLAPDRDRLQLVDDIRATASERITALRSTREKLRNADVTVSVGKRDIFTLHF